MVDELSSASVRSRHQRLAVGPSARLGLPGSRVGSVEGRRLINIGQLTDQSIYFGIDPHPLSVVAAFEDGWCSSFSLVSNHLYRVADFDVVEVPATIVSPETDPNDMR